MMGVVSLVLFLVLNPKSYEMPEGANPGASAGENAEIEGLSAEERAKLARVVLESLVVKGRAPKTEYAREQFYKAWPLVEGCSLRQRIIRRELGESAKLAGCDVIAGEFVEPYTGELLKFLSKGEISKALQIDHVVALSDAWQKGAQEISKEERLKFATDPLNLLAVEGVANMQKGDGDAATWLPKNKGFRCQYVARQISVKRKYRLWVTEAEREAMRRVLAVCPREQVLE